MQRFVTRIGATWPSLPGIVLAALAVVAASRAAAPEQRAVWANYRDIQTPEAVERTVARMAAARLNTIYVLVWYNGGQAAYRSALSPMMPEVLEGHDPLGTLIALAHPQGIHVHAWFVNGSYGWADPGAVFPKHPDWELQTGRKTRPAWYDLGKPEVRAFERDVMLECLRNYALDGIHFDYIRFDRRGMCRCTACQAEVQKRYGVPALTGDRDASFPLAAQFSGNPLDKPSTAHVLAAFGDGVPAITRNTLGKGEVWLLNWTATRGGYPAVAALATRLLARFGVTDGKVWQLRNRETTAKYSLRPQQEGLEWLRGLGCRPVAIDETQLAQVAPQGTVVLQAQYYIGAATAEWLAGFVSDGGHALFVDGPVFAVRDPALQNVLGLTAMAKYFNEFRVITPVPGQDLVPAGPPVDVEAETRRAEAWARFWTESVTDLVRQVYRGAKALKPRAQVSAAVFYNRKAADSVCQDWYGWLEEGIIDYVLPMAYTAKNDDLKAALDEWQAADPALARIIPGLSIYAQQDGQTVTRDLALVQSQQELCRTYAAHGNCYFSREYLSDALAAAFAAGPYATPTDPYYPPSAGLARPVLP